MRLKEFFLHQNDDQFNHTKDDLRKLSKFTLKPSREPTLDFYLYSLERVILTQRHVSVSLTLFDMGGGA